MSKRLKALCSIIAGVVVVCVCVCVCVWGGGGFSVGQSGPIRELKRSGTGTAGHDSWTRIRASHGRLSSQQIITQALISYSSNCSFVLGGRRSEVSGGGGGGGGGST